MEAKENYFVVGDVHGCFDQLTKLLTYHKPETEQLVFLGDYVDRGPQSKQVLDLVMEKHAKGAWCLKGNHEDLLERALRNLSNPNFSHVDYQLWLKNGGDKTVDSFELGDWYTHDEVYAALSAYKPFLNQLDYYKETDHLVFVHAGVDLFADDWRTEYDEMLWVRDVFHNTPNNTGKTVVFGHTPTMHLNKNGAHDVWVSNDNKVGLDGGAVFGGVLHGVVLNHTGAVVTTYSV